MDLREVPPGSFQRHPWELARRDFFRAVLDDVGLLGGALLDVGAGDAWLAAELCDAAPGLRVTCWDEGYADRALATRARRHERVTATATQPNARFDGLLLLDVLEHVDHDEAFLRDVATRNLTPGGRALISVPAYGILFSGHDVALGHHRRYTPGELRALVAGAGLTVLQSGGLFHSLLLPRAVQLAWQRVRPAPPRAPETSWRGPAALAQLMRAVLGIEAQLSRRAARAGVTVPGLTTWALCRS